MFALFEDDDSFMLCVIFTVNCLLIGCLSMAEVVELAVAVGFFDYSTEATSPSKSLLLFAPPLALAPPPPPLTLLLIIPLRMVR